MAAGPPHTGFTGGKLQSRFPKTRVEIDRIFRRRRFNLDVGRHDRRRLTLALTLVERDNRPAQKRAKPQRPCSSTIDEPEASPQHSSLLEIDAKSDRIQDALHHIRGNLSKPLSIERLAQVACLSPRQFSRVFPHGNRYDSGKGNRSAAIGVRPVLMLEQGRVPVEARRACKWVFGDRERLRRSFLRTYGRTPPIDSKRGAPHSISSNV